MMSKNPSCSKVFRHPKILYFAKDSRKINGLRAFLRRVCATIMENRKGGWPYGNYSQ